MHDCRVARKDQTLAYRKYISALMIRKARRLANGSRASALLFPRALHSHIFEQPLCPTFSTIS